jgi:hypothetical protein
MFARLSVGLEAGLPELAKSAGRREPLDAALTHVMAMPSRVGPRHLGFPHRGLIFVGPDLARYVQYRTTKHSSVAQWTVARGHEEWKREPLYVYAEAPVLLVEASLRELGTFCGLIKLPDDVPDAYRRLLTSSSPIVSLASLQTAPLPAGIADVVAWTAMAPDGGYVRCFLLVRDRGPSNWTDGTPTIRALRIYLLRLVAERQNIRRLFEWLDKIDYRDRERALDDVAIQQAFTNADRTLRRLEERNITGQLAQHLAGDYVERVHPGESDSLRVSLEQIFSRRTVRDKANSFLDRDRQWVNVIQYYLHGSMGVGRMGDDFRNANIASAAVGSSSVATNSNIRDVSQHADADAALAAELAKVFAAMRAEAKTPGQQIAADQVEKAAESAQRGKAEHTLAYLKSAGSWALDIAAKIGADVAKGVISRAIGLP